MKEIERKFLVKEEEFAKLNLTLGEDILQGYLKNTPTLSIRLRVTKNLAFITIKGATTGISRDEFEYEIPKSLEPALILAIQRDLKSLFLFLRSLNAY